jgi:hypothetical protein
MFLARKASDLWDQFHRPSPPLSLVADNLFFDSLDLYLIVLTKDASDDHKYQFIKIVQVGCLITSEWLHEHVIA